MIITGIAAHLMGRVKATATKCSEMAMTDFITPEQARKHMCMLVNHAAHADIPPPEPETTMARMIAGAKYEYAIQVWRNNEWQFVASRTSFSPYEHSSHWGAWYPVAEHRLYKKDWCLPRRVLTRLVIDLPQEETENDR